MNDIAQPFVDIRQLTVTFTGGRKPVRAVGGVDLQVQRGEVVALIGESGSGKSVTLRSLLRLHPPRRTQMGGQMLVGGQDVLTLSPKALAQYRGKTALVIATDHGRGDGREGWKDHHARLPGSERIWIAVLGPEVQPLGLRKGIQASQGQVASTVAQLLGYDFREHDPRIAEPLPLAN